MLRFGTGILDENFVSDISTRYGSSAEFLSLYGLLNIYIYTMAFIYSPGKNAHLGESVCIQNLRTGTPNQVSIQTRFEAYYTTPCIWSVYG